MKTPELITSALSMLSEGSTLEATCKALGFSRWTWQRWVDADPDLYTSYRAARSMGADAIADDILNIVDTVRADSVEVSKARLRAETRMRLLSKWQPDKYGDKVDVRHAGPDGGPVQVAHANVADLARQMRAVLHGAPPPEALAPPAGSDLL